MQDCWSFTSCFSWTLGSSSKCGKSTRSSDRLHDFSVTISRCYKDAYVNSFFPRTARAWNSLPLECFPLTYDLSGFKSKKTFKTFWPLFMDGVQLPQGYSHFEEAVYFLPLSSQKFLVLILSTSEGWEAESTLESPSGFEHGTPGLEIQCLNHLAIARINVRLLTIGSFQTDFLYAVIFLCFFFL